MNKNLFYFIMETILYIILMFYIVKRYFEFVKYSYNKKIRRKAIRKGILFLILFILMLFLVVGLLIFISKFPEPSKNDIFEIGSIFFLFFYFFSTMFAMMFLYSPYYSFKNENCEYLYDLCNKKKDETSEEFEDVKSEEIKKKENKLRRTKTFFYFFSAFYFVVGVLNFFKIIKLSFLFFFILSSVGGIVMIYLYKKDMRESK